MDLYVERQCVDQMKGVEPKKFMMLFDACFADVYRYVARRVHDPQEVETITKLTFLDASGQIQNTPSDIAYVVWLYSLAHPRIARYVNKASFPKKQGLINAETESRQPPGFGGEAVIAKADGMFRKLTMEEAEILRLKFFEELADGDVHFVIGGESSPIGPRIYRVLKRAHFLLFGESDQRQGIYFGELSGFLERVKEAEKIEIPEAFRLSLRMEILSRLEKREFAVDVSATAEELAEKESSAPWKEIAEDEKEFHTGSNDPAKIFTEAVKEMEREKVAETAAEIEKIDRAETVLEIFEKVKWTLILIPIILFVVIGVVVGKILWPEAKISRRITGVCPFETQFSGRFEDSEKLAVDAGISRKICEEFKPRGLVVDRAGEDAIKVNVDVGDGNLLYDFVRQDGNWKMKKYAKTSDSDAQQRKIQRNI